MREIHSARLEAALAIVRQASVRLAVLSDPYSVEAGQSLRTVAERLYLERRRRDEYFPVGLFGEPAWDLLLSLFIAGDDGREVPLAEAYKAAKVEPEDGPALIDRLVNKDLVARSQTRRNAITLTPHGMDRLSDYLADLI
ncbi:MAG: hypothetical protein ABIR60_07595 [Allosphingosinicella sp.]